MSWKETYRKDLHVVKRNQDTYKETYIWWKKTDKRNLQRVKRDPSNGAADWHEAYR